MSPFGSVVPAVLGLVMALVLVVWAVVAVILIGAATLPVLAGACLLRLRAPQIRGRRPAERAEA